VLKVTWRIPFVVASILLCSTISLADVYKYKDRSGNWVFGDKKPSKGTVVEEIKIKQHKTTLNEPRLFFEKQEQRIALLVKNPFFAPIEIKVTSPALPEPVRKIVPANSTITLHSGESKLYSLQFRWAIGPSNPDVQAYRYRVPVDSRQALMITQGFNGRFSHTGAASQYAVDIAMPVGTPITAARSGTVIWTKDDYHMAGQTQYFLDKANYISILHDDGSYAQYAHILLGSAKVNAGDRVNVGDVIARSGSSGFSTGPHLHFVIRKNEGFRTQSVEFVFGDKHGGVFTPKAGMFVAGDY